jgi:O-antigen/teichoic acid export membrane protein
MIGLLKGEKMKSLASNAIFNIIYKLAAIIFPLITTAYASRVLMPAGIGSISYAQNIASYFVALAILGLPVYGVREMSRVRENKADEDKLFSELVLLSAFLAVISSAIYIILVYSVDEFHNNYFLYFICGIPVFLSFLNIDWFYQAKEKYGYIAIRSIIIKILSLFAVLLLVKSKDDYLIYALLLSIATVGNYIFNVVHARKYVRFRLKSIQFKNHIKPLASLGLVAILGALYSKVDITMLGVMGSDKIVGLYSNAHKGIDVILTLCAAITATFLPRLSIYGKDNKQELEALLNLGFKVVTFISIPAAIGLFIVAPQLTVLLFGDGFAAAATTMRIFSVLIIIRVYGDLFAYQLLIAMGEENKRVIVALIATIVNIILNALLIPKMLQNGAAIASIVTELIMNGVIFIYVIKKFRFNLNWKSPLFQATISSVIMGLGVYIVLSLINSPVYGSVMAVLIGILIYLLINMVLKNDFLMAIKKKLLMITGRHRKQKM